MIRHALLTAVALAAALIAIAGGMSAPADTSPDTTTINATPVSCCKL